MLVYFLTLNLAAFLVYWADKRAARRGGWRTRETVLLGLSLLGGAFGGLLAMLVARHKTRKPLFWLANLFGCAAQVYLLVRWL